MGRLLKIGEASKSLGIDQQTLRAWSKKGKIDVVITPSGHRMYDEDVINQFKGIQIEKNDIDKKKVFIYARVSTKKQQESGNLERQIARLTEYAIKKGYIIQAIYKEVASGINENRKNLSKLLNETKEHPKSIILIEYKDRLARFGYSFLEKYIQDNDCSIEIMKQKEANDEQELVEDMIAITTSFSARMYGKRGGKKAIKELQTILTKGENN